MSSSESDSPQRIATIRPQKRQHSDPVSSGTLFQDYAEALKVLMAETLDEIQDIDEQFSTLQEQVSARRQMDEELGEHLENERNRIQKELHAFLASLPFTGLSNMFQTP
ncbi:hypothetical protein BLNAU_408 [Blattamonas nauphoetae]|uniref:Uncharacterized protein n=1 Tax=Blattamonas nauphoetae TaxID=2049346 RepID=A0ABQ9YL73_9EUKA|nr:hypothetical protein BLNAU_408 [Blattamonas nauphoetae]